MDASYTSHSGSSFPTENLAEQPYSVFATVPSAGSPAFDASLQAAIAFVTRTFSQEIERQQLYYHGFEHVHGVAARAQIIFDAVLPFCEARDLKTGETLSPATWARRRGLLHLGAIAHDMIQSFLPQSDPHLPRRREEGRSEQETFARLLVFLQQANAELAHEWAEKKNNCSGHGQAAMPNRENANLEQISQQSAAPSLTDAYRGLAQFSETDIAVLKEAIDATVCQFDPTDGAIFQPLLYSGQSISLVARSLALADIGTLGMAGIAAYKREGGLLLLEENLDVIPFLQQRANRPATDYADSGNAQLADGATSQPVARDVTGANDFGAVFREGLRQRLLKRARFEVTFARSRLVRLDQELQGLPVAAIAHLKQHIFTHLNTATIDALVDMTPTADATPLEELLDYFQLEACLRSTR